MAPLCGKRADPAKTPLCEQRADGANKLSCSPASLVEKSNIPERERECGRDILGLYRGYIGYYSIIVCIYIYICRYIWVI